MKSYTKTVNSYEKKYENKGARKLSDLKGYFSDKKSYDEMLAKKDIVVYETFTKSDSPMKYTLTVVNPGRVGKEFFMTKGHIHGNKTEEFYILLEGKGKLLLQNKSGKVKVIDLKKGEIALIEKGFAHRLVNTGLKKLKVHTIYHEDSKPNYSVKFKRIFKKK